HWDTLMPAGAHRRAPVSERREGDRIIVCTDEQSVKGRNARRDPRVALSITDMNDPYSQAQLRGRVVERRRDEGFKHLDTISKKYVGKPWPYREEVPVALVIEIEKARYSKEPFEHQDLPHSIQKA